MSNANRVKSFKLTNRRGMVVTFNILGDQGKVSVRNLGAVMNGKTKSLEALRAHYARLVAEGYVVA